MNYTPTNWVAHETLISADRMNNIESGIAAFYPQTQIIAPEQTVTITNPEQTLMATAPKQTVMLTTSVEPTGVPITLAEGVDVSTFSKADLVGLSVSINGEVASLNRDGWTIEVDGGDVFVSPVKDPDDSSTFIGFSLSAISSETGTALPGNYTVKITRTVAEIPMLRAFTVSFASGESASWVIDAPVAEVNEAMSAGCVLLCPSRPGAPSGFAFGIIATGTAYYATLYNGSFEWHMGSVMIVDGKYALTA